MEDAVCERTIKVMSTYINLLLVNRIEIKDSVVKFDEDSISSEFNSDLYDDLLTLEAKIEELYRKNLITDKEILLIHFVSSGKSYRELERIYKTSRVTLSKSFKQLCSKLAFYLGEHFTDEGYIKHLQEKYRLSTEEAEKAIKYFRSL